MKNYYNIILLLKSSASRLQKEKILTENSDDEIFRKIFQLTYNPYINFYIKKIPEHFTHAAALTLNETLPMLDKLIDRTFTGNHGIKYLKNILELSSSDDGKIIELIIKKDLDCGVSVATINKIWPKLIPEFKIMKCHDSIEHIKFPAIAQPKIDSSRCVIECLNADTGDFIAYSSSGREIDIGDKFKSSVQLLMRTGEKFDGELICYENSSLTAKPLDRKTSNGIISKAIKRTIADYEQDILRFIVWDIVDETSSIPYLQRLGSLAGRFFAEGVPHKISLINYKTVDTIDDAYQYFDEIVQQGGEGIIVKNYDNLWEGKRVKSQGKLKEEYECELRIIELVDHKKKVGQIGAFVCQTECGKGTFQVGSGLTDEIRSMLPSQLIDKIITVRFNQLIHNKSDESTNLYLPRFVEFRHDKLEADTLQRISDIYMSKERK